MAVNSFFVAELPDPRIPTLPSVALQITRLMREAEPNLQRIAMLIQGDPALSIKVMRAVNAPYFGQPRQCATIPEAVERLGLNAVKGIVLGFRLIDSVSPDNGSEWEIGFDYVCYWRRALQSAGIARELATASQTCDPDEAYLAALIQDVGMTALFHVHGDLYLQAIDMTNGVHAKLSDIEQRSFGTDHQQIGAALAKRWNLPEQLVESICFHHNADFATDSVCQLATCVDLAGRIVECGCRKIPTRLRRLAAQWLNLDASTLDALLPRMLEMLADAAHLVDVNSIDAQCNHDELLAEAEAIRVEHELTMLRLSEQGCDPVDHSLENTVRIYNTSNASDRAVA